MKRILRSMFIVGVLSFVVLGVKTIPAISVGLKDGFDIHVQAPHMMADGTVGGPYHHCCKGIQGGEVLQCLIFVSTKVDTKLVAVQYFIEKNLARKNVPLIQWNRKFHDHEVEIAGGRVVIRDPKDPEGQKVVAAAAGKTDGVIFHLWGKDQVVPDGTVTTPNAIGHVHRTK
jgi:hypothetical protein